MSKEYARNLKTAGASPRPAAAQGLDLTNADEQTRRIFELAEQKRIEQAQARRDVLQDARHTLDLSNADEQTRRIFGLAEQKRAENEARAEAMRQRHEESNRYWNQVREAQVRMQSPAMRSTIDPAVLAEQAAHRRMEAGAERPPVLKRADPVEELAQAARRQMLTPQGGATRESVRRTAQGLRNRVAAVEAAELGREANRLQAMYENMAAGGYEDPELQERAARLREQATQAREDLFDRRRNLYAGYTKAEDYTENSRPRKPEEYDPNWEIINGQWAPSPKDANDRTAALQQMSEEERELYNYLYNTEGKASADAFVEFMQETLNYREGAARFGRMNVLQKAASPIQSGVQQFGTGMQTLLTGKQTAATPDQYAAQRVREQALWAGKEKELEEYRQKMNRYILSRMDGRNDVEEPEAPKPSALGKLLQAGFDMGTTVGNMLPSILVSSLTGGMLSGAVEAGTITAAEASRIAGLAGSATLGASAGGNAFNEALKEGWTRDQAGMYGLLVGASEAGMQYALGGITKLGGGAMSDRMLSRMLEQAAHVDSAAARFALSFGARMVAAGHGEGLEEGLQELLEPAFRSMIAGEEYHADAGDVAYSYLMGFASAFIFEAGDAWRAAKMPPEFQAAAGRQTLEGYMGPDGVDWFEGCETEQDVRKRFRELAKQHHEDAGGDKETMQRINVQHEIWESFFKGQKQAGPQRAAETAQEAGQARQQPEPARAAQTAQEPAQAVMPTFQDVNRQSFAQSHTLQGTAENAQTGNGIAQTENGIARSGNEIAQIDNKNARPASGQAESTAINDNPAEHTQAVPVQPVRLGETFEQNQNGGMTNGAEGTEPAEAGAEAPGAVSDGGRGRLGGERAGGQAGSLDARRPQSAAEQLRAASARQAAAKAAGLGKVSPQELGIRNGTQDRTNTVLPERTWDAEQRRVADEVRRATGKNVQYVLGKIGIRTKDGTRAVRGVWTQDGIILQADNTRATVKQIADHELYHDLAQNNPGLNREIRRRVQEAMGKDLDRTMERYIEKLRGLIDIPENGTELEIEQAVDQIAEEIFADAYAGINSFAADAPKYQQAVQDNLSEWGMLPESETAAATERTTGPPEERAQHGTEPARAGNERFSLHDKQIPTYEELVKKPDIKVVDIRKKRNGSIRENRKNLLADETTKQMYTRPVLNRDTGESFFIIPQTLTHTFSNLGWEQVELAIHLPEIIEHAVLTHAETSRKAPRDHTTGVFTLFGAARTDNGIQPVKLKVKEYNVEGQELPESVRKYIGDGLQPQAYASVYDGKVLVLESIEKEEASSSAGSAEALRPSAEDYPSASSEISIKELIGLVKGDAEKYIPKPSSPDNRYSADEDEGYIPQSAAEYAQMKQRGEASAPKAAQAPVAESRPIIAKNDFRKGMLELFSIPEGKKQELGKAVDYYAERMLKRGALTEQDRKNLFDRLYAEGVMTLAADEYRQEGRKQLQGARIYVDEATRADLGDDWNEVRKQAFAAGIYLTTNKANRGVDTWNQELAAMYPGLFNERDTDMRGMLEKIVQLAEDGKDEKMSLPEYLASLAGREFESEDAALDDLERRMNEQLTLFAEKAKLEIRLRDRTGVKLQQQREHMGRQMDRQRAREIARQTKEREARKELAQQQRDRKALQELQMKTLRRLQWLNKNRNRMPEDLRQQAEEVLGDLDLYAIHAADETRWSGKHQATWRDLADIYKQARETDPNFLPSGDLEKIVKRLDNEKIGDLDPDALADLYRAAVGLQTELINRHNVIGEEHGMLFSELYEDATQELIDAEGGAKVKPDGDGKFTGDAYRQTVADRFLNREHLTPENYLLRMAGWKKNGAFGTLVRQLVQGEREMRAYIVRASEAKEAFTKKHEDWLRRADGQGKDAIWYEIEVPEIMELGMGDKPIFGKTFKVFMTPLQKVQMYLESKGYDNLRHMLGGRTFPDRALYEKGKTAEAFAQGRTVRMAPETVKALVSDLTPEERELAGLLETWYNKTQKEDINRKSNLLLGFDKAMSGYYAPIYTNQNYVHSELGVFNETAEGVGNLKGRVYAKNPSYNISALDAFDRSVQETARYVGMAVPVRNWQTYLNWTEKAGSSRDIISHKWGKDSVKYIEDLINNLQARTGTETDVIGKGINRLLSNYIGSVFGANPGVVLKQAASFPQLAAELGWENMPGVRQLAKVDEALIDTYTKELAYRKLGYATPETAVLTKNPSKLETNKTLNFMFRGGAIIAMDAATVKRAWPWAENKVRREHPELETGTPEQIRAGESPFYKKVAEEFEDAVALTQPMYDEMHRAEIMKGASGTTRAFTMFKTVQLQQYNTLRRKFGEWQAAKSDAKTEKNEEAGKQARQRYEKAAKGAAASVTATIGSMLMLEAIELLNNLLKNKGKSYRDDEGELTVGSVAGEFMKRSAEDTAGMMIAGKELTQFIENLFLGEKWWGIEIPGGEQLNEIIDETANAVKTIMRFVGDWADLAKNGGDVGEYLHRYAGDYAGAAKDLIFTLAKYIKGLPVENVEKYLMGVMQYASPELHTELQDTFATPKKTGLKGLGDGSRRVRLENILEARGIQIERETAEVLAGLYGAGFAAAVPPDTPKSMTINGESRTLSTSQSQEYERMWREAAGAALDELVKTEDFRQADEATRAKMLKKVYDYAAQKAKEALFEDYEANKSAQTADALMEGGANLADWAAGFAENSDMTTLEKYRAAVDLTDDREQQMKALEKLMGADEFEKLQTGVGLGVEPKSYIEAKEAVAAINDNTNVSMDEAERGIGSMKISEKEKAILWQMMNRSWKPGRNPFDTEIGQQVYDAMHGTGENEPKLQGLSLPTLPGVKMKTARTELRGLSLPRLEDRPLRTQERKEIPRLSLPRLEKRGRG